MANDKDEPIGERNRLVVLIVVLISLAIINSLAFRFPSAWEHLTGSFYVGNLIKVIALVIMLSLILPLRYNLVTVANYYMRRWFKVNAYAGSSETGRNVNRVSNGLANIVAIAISWPIAVHFISQLLLMEGRGSLDWINIIIHVSFSLLLVYHLIMAIIPLIAIVDTSGKESSKPICPRCGASNLVDAKFCISCGTDLTTPQVVPDTADKQPTGLMCPSCGASNVADSKYCFSCGANLDSPQTTPEPPCCKKCGTEYVLGSKFCKSCGTALPGTQENTPET
jgi:ribosomal protein L40E